MALCVPPLNRSVEQPATVGINRMVRLLKQVVNEAAGERTPEAYPLGYVEDVVEMRTKLGTCFSNRLRQSERVHESFDGRSVVAGQTQFFVDLAVLHVHRKYHDSSA